MTRGLVLSVREVRAGPVAWADMEDDELGCPWTSSDSGCGGATVAAGPREGAGLTALLAVAAATKGPHAAGKKGRKAKTGAPLKDQRTEELGHTVGPQQVSTPADPSEVHVPKSKRRMIVNKKIEKVRRPSVEGPGTEVAADGLGAELAKLLVAGSGVPGVARPVDDEETQSTEGPRTPCGNDAELASGQSSEPGEGVATELPDRPCLSIGSEAHESGSCKPCLFAFIEPGCPDGAQCRFCHLPHKSTRSRPCKAKRDRYRKLIASRFNPEGPEESECPAEPEPQPRPEPELQLQ